MWQKIVLALSPLYRKIAPYLLWFAIKILPYIIKYSIPLIKLIVKIIKYFQDKPKELAYKLFRKRKIKS